MTTDIELRLKSLQWARIHRAESWNPKDKDGDLLQAAEKVYKWLKQDDQPAPQDRLGRGVAQTQDRAAAEPKTIGTFGTDKDSVTELLARIGTCTRLLHLFGLEDMLNPMVMVLSERNRLRDLLAQKDTLCATPPTQSPEVKAAFAEAANQVAPATPQEDLEARRANEPVESAPSAFRSEMIDLIKKHRNIGPDGAIEYSKYSFMEAVDRVWQTTWKSPLVRVAAASTGRVGESLWILVDGGGCHAKAVIEEHTIRPGTNEDCYRVRRGCQYETVWGNDEGVTWAWTRDGFMHPVEAPAEQPAAKRVPEVGDLVSYSGGDAVVFNVAHLPHFCAIRVNSDSSTTVALHADGMGWTFKD